MQYNSSNKYLIGLIKEGEHLQQDFKYEISDSKKIARTLSAFANTEGGRLLIGVKDNGNIKGVSTEEEFHMIKAASEMYTTPKVPFEVQSHEHKGLTVLEIKVAKGNKPPYHAPDQHGKMRAYIRVKDQNFVANTIQYLVWKNETKEESVRINYDRNERFLLNYLSEKPSLTLRQFIRYAGITRNKAISILTDMVRLKLVKIIYSDKETHFVAVSSQNEIY